MDKHTEMSNIIVLDGKSDTIDDISGGGDDNVQVMVIGDGGGSSNQVSRISANQGKGLWSQKEDDILSRLVADFGPRNWDRIAQHLPGRSRKSCRLRWCNQLDPAVNRKPFTDEEDRMIIRAHASLGNKWESIATFLPGRTDNAIKNHWNSALKRRTIEQGKLKVEPNKLDVSSSKMIIQYDDKALTNHPSTNEPKDPPSLYRPVARAGAFCFFLRPPNAEAGISKSPQQADGEPLVPRKCGHGCCGATPSGEIPQSSLLGPEFVDYEEIW